MAKESELISNDANKTVVHETSKFPSIYEEISLPLELDETEVLKRYETVFRVLAFKKVCQPLTRQYDESDIDKNIQSSIIDWATNYALEGEKYLEEIQGNMQYTVLQAALILTISMTFFIAPPDFSYEAVARWFSAFIGGAAFCQIAVIIGCTIMSALLNRPYCQADSIAVRVEAQPMLVTIFVLNYLANLMTIISMLIAGFDRNYIDGSVQLYSIFVVIFLFVSFLTLDGKGAKYQDGRALSFYTKYCDFTGRLKPEYLAMVYETNK